MRAGGSRRKGHNFELQVAKTLSKWWGEEKSFSRTPLSGGWRRLSGMKEVEGYVSGDLVCPKDFPFVVECKKVESFQWQSLLFSYETSEFKKWYEHCLEEAVAVNKVPIIIFSKNRWKPVCCLEKKFYEKLHINTNVFTFSCRENGTRLELVFFLLKDFVEQVLRDNLVAEFDRENKNGRM
jgi:hypothetical protein